MNSGTGKKEPANIIKTYRLRTCKNVKLQTEIVRKKQSRISRRKCGLVARQFLKRRNGSSLFHQHELLGRHKSLC